MDVLVGKIVVMLSFFGMMLVATLVPVLLSKRQKNVNLSQNKCENVLNVCNSIGGGVLLATCFIALVPLVERSYEKALLLTDGFRTDYPYAEITILCGFFFVIFLEQIVILREKSKKRGTGLESPEEETLFSDTEEISNPDHCNNSTGHSHSHVLEAKSLIHSVVLVVTLGLHTLFEGMAIGLVNDVDLLLTLVLAVTLHALCCAVALGVNLGQQKITKTIAAIVCIIYSAVMPTGIGLGIALGEIQGFGGLLFTAILQGIATGTFLYVLFMEIIPSSISSGISIIHMLWMFVGCVLMTILIVATHSHKASSGTLPAVIQCTNVSLTTGALPP